MKIFFIFPNIRTLIPSVYSFAIGALSATLKRHNHQVSVFSVNCLKDIDKIPTILRVYNPDIVGFTGISSQFPYIARMATLVKQWKNIPVICGGTHATLFPDDFIRLDSVDGVLLGEGDEAFLEYIEAIENSKEYINIKNFWFKKNNKIIKNECREFIQDLDSLPYVDREVFDHQRLIDFNNYALLMLAGRGCSYSCTFCSLPYLGKKGKGEFARMRGVEHVLGEVRLLSQKYKFKHIYFRDDTFTWNNEWTKEFCEEYPRVFKYPFDILTRADCLDKETMDSLKQAGCHCVWIGIDSGNRYIANDVLKKDIPNEKTLETCAYLQSLGIKVLTTNMVGLPFETVERFKDTIELNKKIYSSRAVVSLASGTGPKIFVFSPFPGTDLYDLCEKEGWVSPMKYGFRVYQESIINMPYFPQEKVISFKRKFRYLVYKDNHPFTALLFRIYDSRLAQAIVDLIPRPIFGIITEIISRITTPRKRMCNNNT